MSRYHISYQPYYLQFKKPAGTSRGYLVEKTSWMIEILDTTSGIKGIGECPILPGLSPDEKPGFEDELALACKHFEQYGPDKVFANLDAWPAINFGLQIAWRDLQNRGVGLIYDNAFSRGEIGIPINGLVWMASLEDMWAEVQTKVQTGFDCVKFKVGAIDFEAELELLKRIRDKYGYALQIRLDANGAFTPDKALAKLERLSKYQIHSIEQPIKPGQWDIMSELCKKSPIPIALDEELIGLTDINRQERLMETVNPHFLILKPSLLGGFIASDRWIKWADDYNAGWWATSALESNIGLNAIAQWVASQNYKSHQGLGTGSLFTNNTPSALYISQGKLFNHAVATA